MIRPTVRDKLLPDALRQGLLQSVLVFALSAARVGGIYAPWALAAAAVSGGKSRGLWALLGAGVGALVFFDFQTGLRFAASAVLIYSANMAFCDTKMYARKGFAPLLAAVALLLVQSVYLVGRSAAQWALGVSASAVAAAVACGLNESRENGRLRLLVVMTAAAAALPQAVPAMAAKTAAGERAAAFRDLYNTMFRTRAAERGENPAVIFDHAAQQTCRNCVLVKRCWQAEYNATYNAFNDACPAMLKRGRAEAEDFPLFFTSRCLHFPELLSAVNTELYAFRLRRQYRARLEDARALAEAQYEHLGEVLGSETAPEPEGTLLRCRVGTLLRPKEGESACGDQLAVFTAGAMLYMLLSDGMGSGAEAHAESAMTVRLLRQFLKAGIRPVSALKTLNTALTLRCQEGGGFTTIDLLALDRRTGAATLYKYGAAASYVKRGGTVTRLEGGSLPAGLQDTRQPPEATGIHLESGSVLVMVSDGVTSEGDDWLRELLASWPGGDSQELAQLILADSRRHGGLKDDCAALALRLEKSEKPAAKRV